MTQKSEIPELGKSKINSYAVFGRTGLQNKCGIDVKAYVIMLRGNLASGGFYDNS